MGSHSACILNVPGLCFHIRPDDGSFEPKHVAKFLILITIYNAVLLTGINYYIIAIHNGMAPMKVIKYGSRFPKPVSFSSALSGSMLLSLKCRNLSIWYNLSHFIVCPHKGMKNCSSVNQ